jgi:hypothetical protein
MLDAIDSTRIVDVPEANDPLSKEDLKGREAWSVARLPRSQERTENNFRICCQGERDASASR